MLCSAGSGIALLRLRGGGGDVCLPSSPAVWPTLGGKLEKLETGECFLPLLITSRELRSRQQRGG